jgi:DNA-binding CsgD family transcriptional regulator
VNGCGFATVAEAPSAAYGGGVGLRTTVVDAIEAIYSDLGAVTPSAWLGRVLEQIRGCIPGSAGGFAYAYDIGGHPSSWRISYPLVHGAPPEMAAHIFRSFEETSPEGRAMVLPRLGPAGTYSAVTGQLLTAYGPPPPSLPGVLDAIHVNALDADDRGVLVALTVPTPRRLAPTERRRLFMIAAHIASARRLLAAVRPAEAEAIFEQNGRAAHVAPGHEPALAALRRRMLRLERARADRSDPEEVLTAWKALVEGKYTLIARFDTDGRRYVVAHENAPAVRDPRGLTATEAAIAAWARRGHSQKFIAYELGLAVGTVGGMLARVFHKLGVRSRAELVERLSEPSQVSRVSLGSEELLLFSSHLAAPDLGRFAQLTQAEREVAQYSLTGMSSAEIAAARRTSTSTVTNQLASAFRKVGVSSRGELAALARRVR